MTDVDQINYLLDASPDDPLEIRDRCMFELMYSSGLRLAELASLDLNAVDRKGGEARVVGKGGKTRILPVGRKALDAIAQWMPVRAELAPEAEAALFVSRRGDRLSHRSIQARLSRWGSPKELTRSFTPTCCDIRLPAICLNPVAICERFKNCWAMRT